MSDQDYSLRAKSQIRKELLSGQAAKIGLERLGRYDNFEQFGRLYNVKSGLNLSLPFTGVETLHPSHIP